MYKINSKWSRDLNLRAKTIKLFKKSIGEILCDVEFGKDFSDMSAKVQMKEKIDKQHFIEIKNFCASKDTTDGVKRQPM